MKNILNNVDNAIILSPSKDTKFKSITKETPISLIKLRGKKLIERQIEDLKSAGIKDIKFIISNNIEEYLYLKEKYSIEIINIDKETNGNIEDLYMIKDELKNTYIINSTDFISENIYNKEESNSWYTLIKTKRYTKKKVVELDNENKIINIKKGGHKKEFLYGSCYLEEKDSSILKKYLIEYFNDKDKKELDWQDIIKDHIDEFNIYGKPMAYETIYSFTSLDDLQRVNLDLEEDNRKLRDIIVNIFEANTKDIKNLRKMETGMTNNSTLFEYKGEEYIIRIPGPGTEETINRKNEYEAYELIKSLKISDKVIFMNERTGVKITKYEKNSRILDINNKDEIVTAINILKKIHESNLIVDHEFSVPTMLGYYEKLSIEKEVKFLKNYEIQKEKIKKIISILKDMDIENKFCHIDAVDQNFLVLENKEIILIDWEYASMADPLLDIVMFAIHGNMNKEELLELANIYLKREPDREEKIRLFSYMTMSSFLWYIWAEYKESMGSDYGNYKYRLFEMSINSYNYIEDLLEESNLYK